MEKYIAHTIEIFILRHQEICTFGVSQGSLGILF